MKNYKFTLSPSQEINLANKGLTYQNGKPVFKKETETKKEQKTIFEGNKTFSEILLEGLIFGTSATLILSILSAFIILFINLIK
jgi:hypothetical protein